MLFYISGSLPAPSSRLPKSLNRLLKRQEKERKTQTKKREETKRKKNGSLSKPHWWGDLVFFRRNYRIYTRKLYELLADPGRWACGCEQPSRSGYRGWCKCSTSRFNWDSVQRCIFARRRCATGVDNELTWYTSLATLILQLIRIDGSHPTQFVISKKTSNILYQRILFAYCLYELEYPQFHIFQWSAVPLEPVQQSRLFYAKWWEWTGAARYVPSHLPVISKWPPLYSSVGNDTHKEGSGCRNRDWDMGNRFCGVSFSGRHTFFVLVPLFNTPYSNRNLERIKGTDRGTHSQYPLASVTGTDISPIQPSWYVKKFPVQVICVLS